MKNNLVAWTSWYCPIKNCEKIIYNTAIDKTKEIEKHLKEHGLKRI